MDIEARLLDAAPVGMAVVHSETGQILYANEKALKIAARHAEAIGRYLDDPHGSIEVGTDEIYEVTTATLTDTSRAVFYRDVTELRAAGSIAADLQHALLPARLPELDGARHAARYLPWTSGADVGGDWYDVIHLPESDAVGVMIGDVAGHSTSAAATMGQLRSALRAYALEGHSPTTVLERVNRMLEAVEPDAIATCCYLELHLAEGTATAVLAGHLPPILCAGGDAEPMRLRLGPPLGVSPGVRYLDTTVRIPSGSALLFYTDGLVEDRRFPIARGMAELRAALVGAPTGDPEALLERILGAGIGPHPRRDDVALLAISIDETTRELTEPGAVRRFHSEAASAASARRFAADVLTAWGLGDLVDTARLLVGEVITNAVQHTVGDVQVRIALRGSRLRVEVRDASERRPSPRAAATDSESGRGLQIVASLADDWGFDVHEGGGKIVWFELVR
ncbi:SpoIIE family protein phosphatase [Dactylosporangium sp. AC04546]|uniref:SpoIIE family protein phosphatase n=1 Tax=Dactylosporangium sp. AC04546 TaxID=2862460 RepID=UPI001EDD2B54|nr:SpoIIE family protein phosphatase [Dactylosporangium sp. AC04546]WVK85854.1 SpoIIE family protein phosphatase [Dactylosporangium sp. AC04546]